MTDREKLVELLTKMFGKTYHPSVIEGFADFLISNGVTVRENSRKAEDCRYYTQNSFWGAGCLGTKEIEPCKGDGCERWKSKEAP